jgi:predicted transcriptional regulator
MSTLEEIEKAVSDLPTDQLARFRAWFDEYEAGRFDRRIERDAATGRLDRLAEQALADFRAGHAREL